jgi:hypothetical protein
VKIISILLTIYTLSLSMMPCADEYVCSDEITESVVDTSADHSSEEEDFCSPFCVCACCAQNIWAPYLLYKTKIVLNELLVAVYRLPDFASQTQSIWQPPKLS